MVTPYIPNTQDDRIRIMETIGISSVDELFRDIPQDRLNPSFELPEPLAEADLLRELQSMAAQNWTLDAHASFLGNGSTNRFVPTIVGHIIGRNEFYTAYTPYQAEVSQGTLQYLYEFQTMICELSGMDVANASLYDGASAVAEACSLALSSTRYSKIAISKTVNPKYCEVVETYLQNRDIEFIYIDAEDGETLSEIREIGDKVIAAQLTPFTGQTVQAPLLVVEFAGGDIEGQVDVLTRSQARVPDGAEDVGERVLVLSQVRREAPLVTHPGGLTIGSEALLQVGEDLHTPAQSL